MIRPLNEHDLEEFVRLRMEGLRRYPWAFGASVEDGIDREKTTKDLAAKNAENFILGFFEGSQMLGMIGFIRLKRTKLMHRGFIWGMYVDPAHQGKGIGRALMQACLDKARQIEGLRLIAISVMEPQEAAWHLYKAFGFEEEGRMKNALQVQGEYADEIMLSLWWGE
ncbi:MAG: GNAT family N-acetyltransferase [Bacteroidota bacterium]